MSELDTQIGGSHYTSLSIQPIELIVKLKCSFIQGCIVKYISRYKKKNGLQDLEKCVHYAKLSLELEDQNKRSLKPRELELINEYIKKNRFTILQRAIIMSAVMGSYRNVVQCCNELIQIEYPNIRDSHNA